jgi:hypothetical protein
LWLNPPMAQQETPQDGEGANTEGRKPPGRPSLFTSEIGEEVCRRLYESEGNDIPESLRQICSDPDMPARATVHRWLNENTEFRDQYARAREIRMDALVDRMVWLSMEAKTKATGAPGTGEAGAKVAAYKLEIDTIKWILSREYAREYGDKISQEISGPGGGPVRTEGEYRPSPEDEAMLRRISETRTKLKEDREAGED